ncbi:type VI secretion system baseplate subunit TssF [Curvibacter gracilis]|uniref:type VI secretion system baseplate subunit TssF n=1 Tax=Curvibacter gracilis TaxID=230310 RepID=UPI000484C93B|nr:type VI secretion system baseplate subunit TssF [Curvibacter gracilis]
MNPHLLDYYNEELVYMREMAGEFARMHPKVARRLGMQGIEIADPYVERLIESFCFLSARMRLKLDAEFPRFTERLLEVLYPNYVCPTPSMAVAQMHPSSTEGDFTKGYRVPRGTALFSHVPDGEVTACEFRTGQDVQLWPLSLQEARLTGAPPDIPAMERHLPAHVHVAGALRLRLRTVGGVSFADLKGLDSLCLYLSGDEQIASHLFELLHTASVASFTAAPGQFGEHPHAVTEQALVHQGLGPDESLLPQPWNSLHGHNLLHEGFACPSRFYFLTLQQLAPGLARVEGPEAEIVIALNRSPGSLSGLVDARQFALFCTPVINLFPRRTDRLEINAHDIEHHLVPDRSRPLDFEVHSVSAIQGQQNATAQSIEFRALYQTLHQDEGNHGRYFSLRREPRLPSDSTRRYGTRTPYIGSEVFVSLVDQREAPYPEHLHYLSVQALLTNRDLPRLIPRNGRTDLRPTDSIPLAGVGLIRPPSAPQPAFASDGLAWRLIRQLNFNHLPLSDMPHREGAQALRDMLRLYVRADDDVANRQIDSLIGSRIQAVTRRLPGSGPLVYGRGIECTLTLDEQGFSGTSPYLFGLLLEHYLARHVAINTFTETVLHSMQRGEIARWPVRMGTRGVA